MSYSVPLCTSAEKSQLPLLMMREYQSLPATGCPLGPEEVYKAVQSVASPADSESRRTSESFLQNWEKNATPGYLTNLLQIIGESKFENCRLLAAILAKNAVNTVWPSRRTPTGQCFISKDEQDKVKEMVLPCLQREPNSRIAVQIGLIVANIAMYDLPHLWPSLLSQLLSVSSSSQGVTANMDDAARRATRTLKLVLQSLLRKPMYAQSTTSEQKMNADISELIKAEHMLLKDRLWKFTNRQKPDNLGAKLYQGWRASTELQVVREALLNLTNLDGVSSFLDDMMQMWLAVLQDTAKAIQLIGNDEVSHSMDGVISRIFERVSECLLAALNVQPEACASYVPQLLPLYAEIALSLDASHIHTMRSKSRLLIVKVLARILCCQVFKQVLWSWEEHLGWMSPAREALLKHRPQIEKAKAAVEEFLNGHTAHHLLQAIVSNFLAISQAELEEWVDAPEQYIRNLDADVSQDTDSPRSCGLTLLHSLLLVNEKGVVEALGRYGQELRQVVQNPDVKIDVIIQQEACYAAMGKAISSSNSYNQVFEGWYKEELMGILGCPCSPGSLGDRILVARATLLVGSCFSALSLELWRDALSRLVQNLHHSDTVIKLTSIVALSMVLFELLSELEEIQAEEGVLEQLSAAEPEGPTAEMYRYISAEMDSFHEKKAACKRKTDHLEQHVGSIFRSIQLLESLVEVDSKVDLLKLLTLTIEVVGDKAEPYLHEIASTLPPVWMSATESSNTSTDTGSIARLHSSLMGLLSHLVRRLTSLEMDHPQVAQVLPFLLKHALNLGHPESEVLVEDGLQLLQIVLKRSEQLLDQYRDLLSQVVLILRKGEHLGLTLRIIECYLLLGGLPVLNEYMPLILAALEHSVQAVLEAKESPQTPQQLKIRGLRIFSLGMQLTNSSMQELQHKRAVISEIREEGLAAAAIVNLLLRMDFSAEALIPILLRMGSMAAVYHSQGGHQLMHNISLINVSFQFAEVLSRVLYAQPDALPSLTGNGKEGEARFLEWLLGTLSTRLMPEVLGVATICIEGRKRRHLGTICACKLICCNASAALLEPKLLATALALGLNTLEETRDYEKDQQEIAEAAHRHNMETHSKTILTISLNVAQSDPIAKVGTQGVLLAAISHAIPLCRYDEVMNQLSLVDGRLVTALTDLMKGKGAGPSDQAQVSELEHAMVKASLVDPNA